MEEGGKKVMHVSCQEAPASCTALSLAANKDHQLPFQPPG